MKIHKNKKCKIMENLEIMKLESVQLAKVEIDSQIATAKQYPRDEFKVIEKIKRLCTIDDETAADCFYVKPVGFSEKKMSRKDKKSELGNTINPDFESKFAVGESVRFAEICISQWGNIKIRTYLKEVGEKTLTAVAEAIDLETNIAVSCEVSRSIWGNNGRYSATTIENTKQAAQSIAYRNAAFKLIPKGLFKSVLTQIKKTSIGLNEKTAETKTQTFETAKNNAINYFLKKGVNDIQICTALQIESFDEIDENHIIALRGFKTAIAEKVETIESIFNPQPEKNENILENPTLNLNN